VYDNHIVFDIFPSQELPMAITFNPFNPLSYFAAGLPSQSSNKTPIQIKPSNSDPGMQLTAGKDSVTLRGVTKGAKQVKNLMGDYELARGMSFTLDINKAKTTDAFGKTDYTEKNHRLFTLDTSPGWSAAECARRLAQKVNDGDAPFRASVSVAKDGAATISFQRS
jgi:hypothetical protein